MVGKPQDAGFLLGGRVDTEREGWSFLDNDII